MRHAAQTIAPNSDLWRMLLLGIVAVAACTQAKPKVTQQPAAPAETSAIIFSHALHLEQEAECSSCHEGIDEATSLDADKLHAPDKDACAECHDVEDEEQCGMCHPDPEEPGELARRAPTPRLHFSHAQHIAKGAECVACHAGVMVATSLDHLPRPQMRKDCFGCHDHLAEYRALRCKHCHESLRDFPIKFVSQFNHEGNYLVEHGRQASAQPELCATCHREQFCADCHSQRAEVIPSIKHAERADLHYIHRGDWISRHAVASRADPQNCTRCHSPKSCDQCHSARGISGLIAGSTGTGSASPHPPDWMNPGSPNNHGVAARRQITQCAGCHDRGPQTNCIGCHLSATRGGQGINPHPTGWDRNGKQDKRMCRYCH